MQTLLKIVAVLFGAYALIIALMAVSQTALLFPRWAVGPAPDLPREARTLRLNLADGAKLHGHLLPGNGGGPPVIGFGGNAWNAADLALFLHLALPESDVAVFHYRGYGPSTGHPSARAIQDDALAIHDHMRAQEGWESPPVAVGFSIGGGPAAHLARHRPLQGVLLVTPFDSLTQLARTHYPWAPVGSLLRHRMAPATDLAGSTTPIAIIAAAQDNIIPSARTDGLRAALSATQPGLVFDRTVPAGHNDIYSGSELTGLLREAMARLTD